MYNHVEISTSLGPLALSYPETQFGQKHMPIDHFQSSICSKFRFCKTKNPTLGVGSQKYFVLT